MANGHGGARPGAGRKPKSEVLEMIAKMDATKAPADVWQKLAEQVDKNDVHAIKTWLNYRYGMPTQTMDLNHSIETGDKIILTGSDVNTSHT